MADREWTSGPWEYSLGADGEYRIYAPCFPGASRAVFDIADVWLPDRGERHANGLLIAAAPDLYEALKAVNKLIAEAAMTGFNYTNGDWAERLFFSQQQTSRALSRAHPKVSPQASSETASSRGGDQ